MTAHQELLLEMLREFDRICRKYDISYMLFAGTALGAVRHGGFIPWDDDLDVILLRPEYERFLKVAPRELKEAYYLQGEFSAHWPMFFSKLRKNGTACMEKFRPRDSAMHQGIYIDIFPCDNLSDCKLQRWAQYLASRMVIANSLDRRGYLTNSKVKKVVLLLGRRLPAAALHRFCINQRESGSRMVHSFLGASSQYQCSTYPREWFTETVLAPFEGSLFPISAHSDALLNCLYGEWHKIPSPEERACKVHGVIVDLNRPYTEYLEAQRKMEVTVFSRSIR